ncbi:hypothetical protein ABT160_35830 [Streptomyces sp. NPDC001941]|uniref:hypothetical protein n=1 Tax=Streptomyces sp. NPDC001941 TaxID=3154659 RepID=UPI0033198DBF
MTYIAMFPTESEAVELVGRLTAARASSLDRLSQHLCDVRMLLDQEERTVWWVTRAEIGWVIESTPPGEALDRVNELAGPDWAAPPSALFDYHRVLNMLLPSGGSRRG